MSNGVTTLALGLADPVLDSQAVFRAVLDAMARPGRIVSVRAPAGLPPGLGAAAGAVALSLLDLDTTLHLDPPDAAIRGWIAFHTGCRFTERPEEAGFGLLLEPDATPFERFDAGSDLAPETGATLVLACGALEGGRRLRLTGPGIENEAVIAPVGLPPSLLALRRRIRFPRGLDLVLCAGEQVVCLPRTTQIEEA